MEPNLQVIHVSERERYDLQLDGETIGHMVARREGDTVLIPHLEVAESYRGQGWATRFALEALELIRAKGLTPVAHCPFVAWVMKQHPETR